MDRRNFIKTGSFALLGTLAAPSFLESCSSGPELKAAGIKFAMEH